MVRVVKQQAYIGLDSTGFSYLVSILNSKCPWSVIEYKELDTVHLAALRQNPPIRNAGNATGMLEVYARQN